MNTRLYVLQLVMVVAVSSVALVPCWAVETPGFAGLTGEAANDDMLLRRIAELEQQVAELKELLETSRPAPALIDELEQRARIVATGLINKETYDRANIQFDEITFGDLIGPVPASDDEELEMSWQDRLAEIKRDNLGHRELVLRGIKCMASYRYILKTRKQRDYIQNDSIQFEIKLSAREYRQLMSTR